VSLPDPSLVDRSGRRYPADQPRWCGDDGTPLVFEALQRLMKDKTAIVIAHRLATIQSADVIFVVDHGTIIQQGAHEQLITSGGLYSELYNTQFRQPEPLAS